MPYQQDEIMLTLAHNSTRPARLRQREKTSSRCRLPLIAFLVVSSIIGGWWRHEKMQVGYCGVGTPHWSLHGRVPDWVNRIVAPHCEVCPPHASCFPDMRVVCDEGFSIRPGSSVLGRLLPRPKCEADRGRAYEVKRLARQVREELQVRHAAWRCGGYWGDPEGWTLAFPSETELKGTLTANRTEISNATFGPLWEEALQQAVAQHEVKAIHLGPTADLHRFSASMPRLPLSCAFQGRYDHLFALLLHGVFVASLLSIWGRRRGVARLKDLVNHTLDSLRDRATLGLYVPDTPRYIHVQHLVDRICSGQPWYVVEQWKAVIQRNKHIRTNTRDSGATWEWVGPLTGHRKPARSQAAPPRRSSRLEKRNQVQREGSI
ncbi:inner nuclear membrane protein enriched at telomere/subtelomere region [Aspergillus nanangensis]|uniref:Inner nuclear membrane protein enriched at telomere/subtelomere region n=1 Tax=Aspergillus nanangensis TaxID=2582783 RepID=A0AAD4CD07_ASPNN|nr:inner nuclear membrane protein enriched at telomere/subtelomere region [Aspergillus nanangensis]